MTDDRNSAALAEIRLERPLRELASVTVDEWAVRRMWQGVQRRTAERGSRGPLRRGLARHRAVWVISTAVAVLLFVAAGYILERRGGGAGALARGALLTREALPFEGIDARAGAAARVEFSDGSRIEASAGARVDALASNAHEFVVLVRQGQARFVVTPGGPRRWLIETRHARVEVVGTVLSVEAGDTGARVAVEEGSVLVRSPALSDGVQRVDAGQSLWLAAVPPPPSSTEASGEPAPPANEAQRPAAPALPTGRLLTGAKPARARPRAAELWESADSARRNGQPARAAALLGRLLDEYPDDSQLALAAFTRGVLQLDQLGEPGRAASSFAQAIGLGIGEPLEEDAYYRWVRALVRAGDVGGARAALAEYARHYPNGRHRKSSRQLLTPETPGAEHVRE